MYDILCDIWKNPGASYSPMPFWFWNDTLDKDELIRQLDDFHKHGIDGFVVHPRMGMQPDYLSEEYFELLTAVVEAAQKRRMNVILYDEAMYPSGSAHGEVVREEPRFAARCLYAKPIGEAIPDGEELLYRLYLLLDEDGRALDVATDERAGYVGFDLLLGYTGGTIRGIAPDEDDGEPNAPMAADLLNPAAVASFIRHTHEAYYRHLHEYFGQTVIGFFTDAPSLTGRNAQFAGVPWTYDLIEDFFEEGGDMTDLGYLLFPAKEEKRSREAQVKYQSACEKRLCAAYFGQIGDWCRKHGIALLGHPEQAAYTPALRCLDIPGAGLCKRMVEPGNELTSPDSALVKAASDTARHMGQSRSLTEVFGGCGERGNPWNFTPDDMMWYLNFLFARGCSMVLPHAFYYSLRTPLQSNERPPDVGPNSIWWDDYKSIAGYVKRMSWLGATGTNNPSAAVLCSGAHTPVRPVKALYEEGHTFNYLSLEDFMGKAHIHDGTVRIDRYAYDTLLVDGRLRLNTEIVKKIGQFVTEGGSMYRGSDFIGFLKKNVRRTSYFDGETHGALRFLHYTKSGCPFFVLINEGLDEITGRLVTDLGHAAALFDPFTGKTAPLEAQMCDEGFAYAVTVPGHAACVIGMNPDALVQLKKDEETWRLSEIVSLAEGRMTFGYHPAENRRAELRFTALHDLADVEVNGQPVGRLLFRPYALDITPYLTEGENSVAVRVTGSMANTYGKPVPVGFEGCTVRVTERV